MRVGFPPRIASDVDSIETGAGQSEGRQRTNSVDSSMTASPSSIIVSVGACESVRRLLHRALRGIMTAAAWPPHPQGPPGCLAHG